MDKIDEGALLERFDRLVYEGIIAYRDDQERVVHEHEGLTFEFCLTAALAGKPTVSTPRSGSPRGDGAEQNASTATPIYKPGSDISTSGFEVHSIGGTHILAFNKFCIARPHFLLLTEDGFRRQYEALDLEDLTAAHSVITSLTSKREYMVLYNGGIDAGCSRLHKHMQVIPKPDGYRLWLDDYDQDSRVKTSSLMDSIPFQYFMTRFSDTFLDPDALLRTYTSLLKEAQGALRDWTTPKEGHVIAHNVVLTRKWIIIIPRRKAGVNGADTNAAGMLGMIWVSSKDRLQRWVELGPSDILAEIGVPHVITQNGN
ncbi:ATP adenylyltransferase [Cladobotryum mycophilum]|uniref:ATP adenylyltransferase n=1 Tax=Cladobotryum mycophilum TaxID=491253 RepID=A0ABR0SZJ5_9HYPO